MRKTLPAVLLAACASLKPPNATEPPDAREGAVTPSDRQLGSRTLPGWPQSGDDRELANLLLKKHGDSQRARIERGLRQVAAMWRPQDGDNRARRAFVEQWFESDPRAASRCGPVRRRSRPAPAQRPPPRRTSPVTTCGCTTSSPGTARGCSGRACA